MKTSLATTTLSFLLLILATKPLIANSAPEPQTDYSATPFITNLAAKSLKVEDVVTDKYGNDVNTTIDYYVVPANDDVGKGGGISLITGRHGWPLDVILNPIVSSNGNRVRFSPADNSSEIVHQWSDLNVIFSEVPEKPSFSVDNYDKNLMQWFITDGGVEGNPGGHTLLNWFKFESDGGNNTYRIVHCPYVCPTCAILCYHIGLFKYDTGVQHLALLPDNQRALSVQLVPKPCVC